MTDNIGWSRRQALGGMVGLGGAAAVGLKPHPVAAKPNRRTAEIVSRAISVDMHNHVFTRSDSDKTTFSAEFEKSGFSAICLTYPVDLVTTPKPGEWYKLYTDWEDEMDALIAQSKVTRVLSFADLVRAKSRGEKAVFMGAEGAQFVAGKIDRISEAYKRGLRLLQPFHSVHDNVSPMGDIQTLNPTFNGLTEFGKDVIRECDRLNLIVDLAHGNYRSIEDTVKIYNKPILFSHTALLSPAGLGSVPSWDDRRLPMRLLRPEEAKLVAQTGGVVGVWHIFPSLTAYVAAIRDLADTVGVEHVGIGTDSGMSGWRFPTSKLWGNDDQPGFVYRLVDEMFRQGFHGDEISAVIGGNFCRVFQGITGPA